MAVGDAVLLTSQFMAAGLFLVLAAVLLAVRFNSRVNRAFAIFLLLRGMALLLQQLSRLPSNDGSAMGDALFNAGRYFVLATPFVLLYFVALYRSPTFGLAVRVAGIVTLAAIFLVEVAFMLDHCAYECNRETGPLAVIGLATPLAQGMAGLLLAWKARELVDNPRAKPLILVASALTLLGLLEGAQAVSLVITRGMGTFKDVGVWLALARLAVLLGFAASAAALTILLQIVHARSRILLIAASVVVVATTLYYLRLESQEQATSQVLSYTTAMFGFWRLLAAAIVAYALVRHRFLDLDLRINWTISRGTVLAIFVASFMVVFKVAENALNQWLGIIFGGVTTGLLMLALKPIERLGDRVADGVLPRGRARRLDESYRVALFREQATMVWADGTMGRKERLLLDNLRERLGIDAKVALSIEHEAASHATSAPNPLALSSRS